MGSSGGRRPRATSSIDAEPSPRVAGAGRHRDVGRAVEHALVEHPPGPDGPAVVDLADPVACRARARRSGTPGRTPWTPLSISIRWTSMPSWWIGKMNTVRPRCFGTSQLVRARQQAPVRPPGARGPHLRTVQHPLVAVADGGGERAGDVGAAARLGEELHPELLALEDGGDVAALLLLGAEVEQHGRARRDRRGLEPARVLVAGDLLVERLLVRRVRPWPPYSRGKQMPARPASKSMRCIARSCATVGELLLVGLLVRDASDRPRRPTLGGGSSRIQVAGPGAERLDGPRSRVGSCRRLLGLDGTRCSVIARGARGSPGVP